MADEARSMWEAFITAPENAALLKRYAKSAKEPAPLFDSIGEDLGSSKQAVREQAYWALVVAMPELTAILHERETRQPGWRDREGKDQQMINRGADILSYLHRKFVVERYFKIGGGYGKDPRPLMNKIIRNRKKDAQRESEREKPPDDEDALEIPAPSPSIEDSMLENDAYEECKKELLRWRFFRNDDEFNLYVTAHVDETPMCEVQERLGIRSQAALRQRLSRANKNIVAVRDEVFTFLLFQLNPSEITKKGKIPTHPQTPERSARWAERAKQSLQPGAWIKGLAADGKNVFAVRPVTTGLRNAPGHIYLVTIIKDCPPYWPWGNERPRTITPDDLLKSYLYTHIDKMLHPTGFLQPGKGGYRICELESYPTELPGINEALAEVRSTYNSWLISYSRPHAYNYHTQGFPP